MKQHAESTPEQYLHRVVYNYRERLVGLFVFSGFILLLLFIVISVKNQHLFERRVIFYIELNSSEGINQGSVVTVLGTEVGRVTSLNLAQDHKIRVTIAVYEQHRRLIRTGARAIVNRLTNIGSALIEIRSDSIDAPVLPGGSLLAVEETPSLNDLLLGLANIVQSADNNDLLNKFENILPKVEQTLANIHQIIAQIASGHGTLGAAVFDQQVEQDLKVVVKTGAELLTEAEGMMSIAKQRLVQLEPVLQDAQYMTHDLRGASANIPLMIKEVNEIIAQIQTALSLINGELQQMPGIAVDAKRTLSKTGQLLDSVQNTWPLSGKDSAVSSKQLIAPNASYE